MTGKITGWFLGLTFSLATIWALTLGSWFAAFFLFFAAISAFPPIWKDMVKKQHPQDKPIPVKNILLTSLFLGLLGFALTDSPTTEKQEPAQTIATQQSANAGPTKTLGITTKDFDTKFNSLYPKSETPIINLHAEKNVAPGTTGTFNVINHITNNNLGMIVSVDKQSNEIIDITIINQVLDASSASDNLITAGIMMQILSPTLSKEERGNTIIELFTDCDENGNNKIQGNIKYWTLCSPITGLYIGADAI